MSTPLTQPAARQLWAALRMMVVMTVVVGLAYPLAMTGFAQVAFPDRADGSLVERNGKVVGSALIGQSFDGRPESAGSLLRRNLLVYGLGGLVAPFPGIWVIDQLVNLLGLT